MVRGWFGVGRVGCWLLGVWRWKRKLVDDGRCEDNGAGDSDKREGVVDRTFPDSADDGKAGESDKKRKETRKGGVGPGAAGASLCELCLCDGVGGLCGGMCGDRGLSKSENPRHARKETGKRVEGPDAASEWKRNFAKMEAADVSDAEGSDNISGARAASTAAFRSGAAADETETRRAAGGGSAARDVEKGLGGDRW